MIIYHFCENRTVRKIFKEGLTQGAVPVMEGVMKLYRPFQWLTLDGDPARQSWATNRLYSWNRTAWRLTIEIPEDEVPKLYDRDRLEAELPGAKLLFDGWEGSENWRVWHGEIPKEWIVCVEKVKCCQD